MVQGRWVEGLPIAFFEALWRAHEGAAYQYRGVPVGSVPLPEGHPYHWASVIQRHISTIESADPIAGGMLVVAMNEALERPREWNLGYDGSGFAAR